MRLLLIPAWLLTSVGCAAFFPDNTPELPEPEDACALWAEPGLYKLTVEAARTRRVWVHVPALEGPRDVVVMMHGAGGTGERMMQLTSFKQQAADLQYVAVFPEGTAEITGGKTWNAGDCCGTAETSGIDDVAFLDQLLAELSPRVCADRVLAAGYSNGGMMGLRWACQGKERPDAVVSVAGVFAAEACDGDPLPMMAWNGTGDDVVPYDGSENKFGESFPSVDDSMRQMLAMNACSEDEPRQTIDGDTTIETWSCEADTQLFSIKDWPHKWPGGGNERDGPVLEDVALAWFRDLADEPEADDPLPE